MALVASHLNADSSDGDSHSVAYISNEIQREEMPHSEH